MYEALNRSGGILTVDLEQVGRKDAFLDCGGLFGNQITKISLRGLSGASSTA